MQNIPKRQEAEIQKIFAGTTPTLRSAFMTTPGWVMVEADYSQAELFAVAYLSNDKNMIDTLCNPNRDIHSETAIKMFSLPYRGFELDGHPKKWMKVNYENSEALRTSSKTVSFGLLYGRGPRALSREIAKTGLKCTIDDARAHVNTFYKLYPDAKRFLDEAKDAVYNPGYLTTMLGRRRRFYFTRDKQVMAAQEREAANFLKMNEEVKQGEFGETPEVDNTERSFGGDAIERVTTSFRDSRRVGNEATSALRYLVMR